MSTLIKSTEAADVLGVSKATLYAYVSRGRLTRTTGSDGRTSLFARDEVERLAERSRRATPGPRPTIDVQITSEVTAMSETMLRYRGFDVAELVRDHGFEDVAELLWSTAASPHIPSNTTWPAARTDDISGCSLASAAPGAPLGRLAIAAHLLDGAHPNDEAADAARRLLTVIPSVLGSPRKTGPYALRLTQAWRRRPDPALVDAIDTALGLLADHELATSTLAVRIAASVRTSPYAAIAAGLASVDGRLHGSASDEVHHFLMECAREEPAPVVTRYRREGRLIPGFGHKVYRGVDPRFGPLMDATAPLDPSGTKLDLVDHVIAEVGRVLPHRPNVDLALGALTWTSGLDPDTPVFAIARIAGWAAHYTEELAERPLRFRGVARTS
ncbi:MAG: citrate/2-methylcitrate synthase [Ilumatobacteraceae bacterium]